MIHLKKKYFNESWNWFDFFGQIFFFIYLMSEGKTLPSNARMAMDCIHLVSIALILNRGSMAILRLFSQTRFFVQMIKRVL
jgi:hypothetical protein